MLPALVDTGPFVSLVDRSDSDHARVKAFLDAFGGRLITTWPVLTEACHLMPEHVVLPFMRWVAGGGTEVNEVPGTAARDLTDMMVRYADRPMDLADASLVWLAAKTGISDILTLDNADFGIYRLPNGKRLRNLLRTS